jgi:hypothetical protein
MNNISSSYQIVIIIGLYPLICDYHRCILSKGIQINFILVVVTENYVNFLNNNFKILSIGQNFFFKD